jgi:hypothetical protein
MNISTISRVYKEIETEYYSIKYLENIKLKRRELVLQSKTAGKHKAIHSQVNILDNEGSLKEIRLIDDNIADFIFRNFSFKGDTDSFNIFEADLLLGEIDQTRRYRINPLEIRHKNTNDENNFTANGTKLLYHKSIFDKFSETGYGSIIRATLTNHQVCASRCQFCSTISRNKKDSVTFEEAKKFVDYLYYDQAEYNREFFGKYNSQYKESTGTDIRLKGLILSGGGQPNLWPYFEEFVDYLSSLDIDLGLITNGFPPKVDEKVYEKFQWIRISITPEDASPFYTNGRFNEQYIPQSIINNPNITTGYSYVFGPWTTDDVLLRMDHSAKKYGFDYCRVLSDCNLPRDAQLLAHKQLAERLYKLGFIDQKGDQKSKIFHQLKYHGNKEEADKLWSDGQCYLQIYNVFWDTTGHEDNGYSYCYACDSVTVLADHDEAGDLINPERKFNSDKWGTVKNTEVYKLYRDPVQSYFDPRSVCSSCLFMKNNLAVKEILEKKENKFKLDHEIKHVNFP